MVNSNWNRQTVLVTRPGSQAGSLSEALEAQGFLVRQVPVMEIVPLQDSTRIEHCFAALDQFAGIIVVSVNAAEQSLAWFSRYHPPLAVMFFAVGQSTAGYLQERLFGGKAREVIYPASQMDSEGLLALPALQPSQVAGKRFLILRGMGGRELIADTLRSRGAEVTACELYRRICPPNGKQLQEGIADADIIVVNSVESLENLLALAGPTFDAGQCTKRLVVPGERVGAAARKTGFRHIICSANATDTAVIDAINRSTSL